MHFDLTAVATDVTAAPFLRAPSRSGATARARWQPPPTHTPSPTTTASPESAAAPDARAHTRTRACAFVQSTMADGAAAGGSSGSLSGSDPRPSAVASARSARQALMLAVQAVSVNEAAVRKAQEDRDAIRKENVWKHHERLRKNGRSRRGSLGPQKADGRKCRQAGAAGESSGHRIGGCFAGCGSTDGPRATSAERARRALLLVTQVMGVSAAAVREARAERELAAMDALGLPATSRAARDGDIDRLRLLLEAGIDTEQADGEGWTPLFWAVDSGEGSGCLRLLLEAGADASNVADNGTTALILAATIGDYHCVKILLDD